MSVVWATQSVVPVMEAWAPWDSSQWRGELEPLGLPPPSSWSRNPCKESKSSHRQSKFDNICPEIKEGMVTQQTQNVGRRKPSAEVINSRKEKTEIPWHFMTFKIKSFLWVSREKKIPSPLPLEKNRRKNERDQIFVTLTRSQGMECEERAQQI